MDPITMLRIAVALLAIAAVGGLGMSGTRLSQKKSPQLAALVHGLLAASGLTPLLPR